MLFFVTLDSFCKLVYIAIKNWPFFYIFKIFEDISQP